MMRRVVAGPFAMTVYLEGGFAKPALYDYVET